MAPGWMLRMRAFAASTLYCPSVSCVAMICRLRFERHTRSLSIRSSAPMPLRASASTAWPPTPPTPNTATRARASRSIPSCPSSSSVRSNWCSMGVLSFSAMGSASRAQPALGRPRCVLPHQYTTLPALLPRRSALPPPGAPCVRRSARPYSGGPAGRIPQTADCARRAIPAGEPAPPCFGAGKGLTASQVLSCLLCRRFPGIRPGSAPASAAGMLRGANKKVDHPAALLRPQRPKP